MRLIGQRVGGMIAEESSGDDASHQPRSGVPRRGLPGCEFKANVRNSAGKRWRIAAPQTTDSRRRRIGPGENEDRYYCDVAIPGGVSVHGGKISGESIHRGTTYAG